MFKELSECLQAVNQLQQCKTLVLQGAEQAFCAGGDIGEIFSHSALIHTNSNEAIQQYRDMVLFFHQSMIALYHTDCIVLARITGPVAGAGLSLVLACDLAICVESAKFRFAYRNIGLSPDGTSTYYLNKHLSYKQIAELVFITDFFSADKAQELGLINWVCPDHLIDEQTQQRLKTLNAPPKKTLTETKVLLRQSYHNTLEEQSQAEANAFSQCAIQPQAHKLAQAFIKKKPR